MGARLPWSDFTNYFFKKILDIFRKLEQVSNIFYQISQRKNLRLAVVVGFAKPPLRRSFHSKKMDRLLFHGNLSTQHHRINPVNILPAEI